MKKHVPATPKGGSPETQARRAKTRAQQDAFLAAFARMGVVTAAAKVAGVDRARHYGWLLRFPSYVRRFADAGEQAADSIEVEITRRGLLGWDEPVFYRGAEVGRIRKYDSVLLLALARARRPAVWGASQKLELSGSLTVSDVDARVAAMRPKARARLHALLSQTARSPDESAELHALRVEAGLEAEDARP